MFKKANQITTENVVDVSQIIVDEYGLETPILTTLLNNGQVKVNNKNNVETFVRRLDTTVDTKKNLYPEGSVLQSQGKGNRFNQKKLTNDFEIYRDEVQISKNCDLQDANEIKAQMGAAVQTCAAHLEHQILFGTGEELEGDSGINTIKGIVEFLPSENIIEVTKSEWEANAQEVLKTKILKNAKTSSLNACFSGYDFATKLDALCQNIITQQDSTSLYFGQRHLVTGKGTIQNIICPTFDAAEKSNEALFVDTRMLGLQHREGRFFAVKPITDDRLDGVALSLLNDASYEIKCDPAAFVYVKIVDDARVKKASK